MAYLVARLYRGPAAGKRLALSRDMTSITIPTMKKDNGPWPYEMVKHHYRRTNHTHPDGSVYFEWDQPRGTKFK